MATSADISAAIDMDLWAVAAEVEFLPELEKEWDKDTVWNHMDWEMEWRDLLGRLDMLRDACTTGAMTSEQQERYHTLVHNFKEAVPILKRLGLWSPPLEKTV